MARSGFGGSGDYSGTFAGLYSANKDSQTAQQAADDQDAFDKWQNGLMSDGDWMSYIRGRIDTYAGDPKKQETWVTNLRKYSVVISDNQAEFAYKNGGSINQLISYYTTRLGTLDKNSTEARDLQLRINDLQDTRSSDSITEGGQKLIDGINKGTKTYGDLQKFLQDQLKTARPNSDLYKSISKQVDSVKEQIRTNTLEGSFEKLQYQYDAGKLSGGHYATQLRTMAAQFKDSDPKRYYQILEAAVALDKGGSRSGGGSGGSGGSAGSISAAKKKSINETIDTIQANRNHTQALIDQYDNLGPGRSGVDPITGKPVVFNEAKIKELDTLLVQQLDSLSAAYTSKGDKSAAANTQKAKAAYVSQNVLAHNTMTADNATRELLVSTGKIMDHASENPDPTSAMSAVAGVAQTWKNYAASLQRHATVTAGYGGDIHRRLPAESGDTQYNGKPLGIMDQVATDRIARANAMAAAFATIAKPGATDEEVTAASQVVMQYDSGVDAPGGAKPIYSALIGAATKIAGNQQGLATGDVQRVVQDGKVSFVRTQPVTTYTTVNGTVVPVTKKIPMVDGVNGTDTKLVDIYMDINGQPTKVSAVAHTQGIDGFNAWVASSAIKVGKGAQATTYPAGTPITDDIIKKLQATGQWNDYRTAGTIDQAPALSAMVVNTAAFTDQYGKAHPAESWMQDGGTGLWYKDKLPVRGAIVGPDGTIKYKAGATPGDPPIADINWQAYGSAAGVPAPYSGTNAQAMQAISNDDQTLYKGIKGRDASGAVVDTPQGSQYAYYNPISVNAATGFQMNPDSWWNADDRKARQDTLVQTDRQNVQVAKTRQDDLMRANMDPAEYQAWKKSGQAGTAIGNGVAGVIGQFARSLGIGIDGTKDRKPFTPPATTSSIAGKAADDLALASARPAKASGPLVRLPDPGKTFTGPAVKDSVDLALPAQQSVFSPHGPGAVLPKVTAKATAPAKAATRPITTTPPVKLPSDSGGSRKVGGNTAL